jgi:hypothetical protein
MSDKENVNILLLKPADIPEGFVGLQIAVMYTDYKTKEKLLTNQHYTNLGAIAAILCKDKPVQRCEITLRDLPEKPISVTEYTKGLSVKLILRD